MELSLSSFALYSVVPCLSFSLSSGYCWLWWTSRREGRDGMLCTPSCRHCHLANTWLYKLFSMRATLHEYLQAKKKINFIKNWINFKWINTHQEIPLHQKSSLLHQKSPLSHQQSPISYLSAPFTSGSTLQFPCPTFSIAYIAKSGRRSWPGQRARGRASSILNSGVATILNQNHAFPWCGQPSIATNSAVCPGWSASVVVIVLAAGLIKIHDANRKWVSVG